MSPDLAEIQRLQLERDQLKADVERWREWSDEVAPSWALPRDRSDDDQRTLVSQRMTALVRQDGSLSERLAVVGHERDAYRAMLCDVIASATPNNRDHPSMSKQWARAIDLLKNGPST